MTQLAATDLPLWMWAACGLALGAIAGSFIAALVIRWPQGLPIGRGRSRCDHCARPLGPAELVPVLSYFMLRGRCASCGAEIDRRHLLLEVAAALIGLTALIAHPGWTGLAGALFGWMLLALAQLDVQHLWLPDRLTLQLAALGLAGGLLGLAPPIGDRLIGMAAGFLLLTLVATIYRLSRGRRGLGGGDPKLFAAIGAWLGWPLLPYVLLLASTLGLGLVALHLARGGRMAATAKLPFGALLAAAAWPIWILGA